MKRYKVIYDRNLCIGAAACNTAAPEGFEIDKEDGKANMLGSDKVAHEKFEVIIDEEQYAKFKDASDVCPVTGCIVVIELED